ncbi:TPA: hypothetical protein ACNH8F_003551 [Pseudomonas aeruginosa]
MSSTQHQLIEQCATRLRGIVEALDNIHDNTPRRWSTELDDVHSSAESLLALIKDQAPARSEASFEEWLANELEGEDGQPVPAAVCDIALARRAFNHWPKLEQPAKVGGVRFSAGVSSRLVVEAAQRLYEFESTPEKEAERIERLQAFREQLDPLNLAPHAEAFNEAPDEALKPEQAEAERPEVVAWSAERYVAGDHYSKPRLSFEQPFSTDRNIEPLMTVAQHERIVEARWNRAMDLMGEHVVRISEKFKAERDAALASVAELEHVLRVVVNAADHGSWPTTVMHGIEKVREVLAGSAPPAKAQHSVPEGYALIPTRETEAMHDAVMALLYKGVARTDTQKLLDAYIVAAPGKEVPQAWLDVQAERRRQITAEGWTPEHDDEHSHGQMARAAACYALAGSSAPNDGTAALLVSLAWPWDEQWWKPTSARRDLVKACSLALAEIERLDRAGISQGPQPGATTASS